MQKRLFTFFLLLSLLPAAVVLVVNWQISQRLLGFMDSPGLHDSLESSLRLARQALESESLATLARLDAAATTLDGGELPEAETGTVLVWRPTGGEVVIRGAEAPALRAGLAADPPAAGADVQRISTGGGEWLTVARQLPGGRLTLARRLAPELAADLAAVRQGGTRWRQLRLVYRDRLRGDTLVTLGLLAAVILAVSLLLSRRLARRVAGPVGALAEGMRRVAGGDLDHRVRVEAPDELGQLVRDFNRMTADLRDSKEELVRAERVAAWRGVARRLAHEIKNPLTPITLAMHRIGRRSDDEAVTEAVATVLEETGNLQRLADEFSHYARLPEPRPETVDLIELARSVADLYAATPHLEVVWRGADDPLRVQADPGQLRQVLANLVKNAVAAVEGRGSLEWTVEHAADRRRACLVLSDSGCGLPPDPETVFEPYFTTRDTGTGLGLPIARRIVEDHGGSLTAENAPGGGARFRLVLPCRPPAPTEERK